MRYLDVLQETQSKAGIARKAGLSRSTILRASQGKTISSKSYQKIYNVFRRTSYQLSRAAGLPIERARLERSDIDKYERADHYTRLLAESHNISIKQALAYVKKYREETGFFPDPYPTDKKKYKRQTVKKQIEEQEKRRKEWFQKLKN
jgi:transcriptional regulator with XRE-family HTH domain